MTPLDPFEYPEPRCSQGGGEDFYYPDGDKPDGAIPVDRIIRKIECCSNALGSSVSRFAESLTFDIIRHPENARLRTVVMESGISTSEIFPCLRNADSPIDTQPSGI